MPPHSTQTLTKLLYDLVQFPTVTGDYAAATAALDWAEQQLAGLPLHIDRYTNNHFPALVATTQPGREATVWLVGHIDVVDGEPHQFHARTEDGRIIGRGVYDMKFAIATYLHLLRELGDQLPQYSLGLMLTSDEEVGGAGGAKWLLDHHGYRGRVALIPDGARDWSVETGAKGVVQLTAVATGKISHASRPWRGHSAIDKLIAFVHELEAHTPTEPCGDPGHVHPTVSLGTIKGGNAVNSVPGSATGTIDIRLTTAETLENVFAWIEAAKQKVGDVQTVLICANASYPLPQTAEVATWRAIVEHITGHAPDPMYAHGASDARFFTEHAIPCIVTYIGGGDPHGHAEWINATDLELFYDVTRQFVETSAKLR